MPDDYDNVGTVGAPPPGSSTREVQLKINHGDPALAVTERMEMSAPIDPVAPTDQPGAVPHEDERPAKPGVPVPPPLHDDVAPFRIPEPRIPATEYVPVFTKPIPRPVPHFTPRPTPKTVVPAPPPAPIPSPAPKPVPLPVMSGQAIGPIIRKRPEPAAPLKVVSPAFTAPAPRLAPIPAAAPAPPETPEPVRVPGGADLPKAQASMATAIQQAIPDAPVVPVAGTVIGAGQPSDSRPLMIFSQNTRAVWHLRRSGKMLFWVFMFGLGIVLFGLFLYWRSLGSPTQIQDIPLLHMR